VDGGCEMSAPIQPPHGIRWCPIPVRDLHIEDELCGHIGLSFPRIDGTSPFIRLPRQVSLEILSHVGLPAIYDALSHLVDVCRSYDDFSGLCPSSSRLSSLLLYFAGHDAIWYMRLRWLENHRWHWEHCTEDIFISKGCYSGTTKERV
jgi:hypothetical protein